jgi:hypothetical protein
LADVATREAAVDEKGGGARSGDPAAAPGDEAGEGRPPQRTQRCRWCGRAFAPHPGPGRPRRFCRPGCRQQAYLARRLAAAHGLGDDDVIVSRDALEELQSRLYCLQAALEDVDRDLATSSEPAEVAEALGWLTENARPLAATWIEPRTAHDVATVTDATEMDVDVDLTEGEAGPGDGARGAGR